MCLYNIDKARGVRRRCGCGRYLNSSHRGTIELGDIKTFELFFSQIL